MKKLDFSPHKTITDFRKNYKLHDLAEENGKNLLTQWGFTFEEFGRDKRYEKVWERGADKPDLIINYKNKKALLDWKGKRTNAFKVNKRAIDSYEKWKVKTGVNVLICFMIFSDESLSNKNNKPEKIFFAALDKNDYSISEKKEWDKNETVQFNEPLPLFTKANLINLLL